MLIGLAGVTSTGKTTMAAAIKEHYGNRVVVQDKISRKEIYSYVADNTRSNEGFHQYTNSNIQELTNRQRALFDIGRVNLQMKKEKDLLDEELQAENRPVIIDGCTLVKITYLIYLSAPFIVEYFGDNKLTEIVEKGLAHCNQYYSSIFYLPVTRLPFAEADHRLFKNEYIRTGQDAILNRLLATKIKHSVDIERFNKTDMNLVFDELSKRGVS